MWHCERLSEKGVLGTTYVAPEPRAFGKAPDSPVVSAKGTVFFEDADEILEIPSDFKSAPKTLFHFAEPENSSKGPSRANSRVRRKHGEKLLRRRPGNPAGRRGKRRSSDRGRRSPRSQTGGILGSLSTAALSLHYNEEAGGNISVAENGWTGGRPGRTRHRDQLHHRLRRQLPPGRGCDLEQGVRAGPGHRRGDRVRALRTHSCPTAKKRPKSKPSSRAKKSAT